MKKRGMFIPRPRFIGAGEIPRLAFIGSLGMTLKNKI